MGADFSYDPVTAIDEQAATGVSAEIFADIRAVMGIPLVTSIWRGLAGMGDSLEIAWQAARPIYQHGRPDKVLAHIVEQTMLPVPVPLAPTQLACAGLDEEACSHVRTIIDAYNRSNGMNLVALSALIASTGDSQSTASGMDPPAWAAFPSLLAREGLSEQTWDLIRHVNAFGAPGIDANVATLWRHLGQWPALLSLVYTGFAPLHSRGDITAATARMLALTQSASRPLATWRGSLDGLGEPACATITGYVTTQTQVVRMVTMGHALARWLA